MPLNVRRFCSSVLLVLISFFVINAQTSADVMRERVAKAKAFIAVKNYNAAIYELENIRRETSDQTVHGVINVLLMNSYLEQGDYKRAQDFLTELSSPKKLNLTGAMANYSVVAAQVVKGARTQLERYRALGLSVADRNLPVEAAADVQKMRETLELVVTQSKVLGKDKDKTANAMALLEEATSARSSLAKDDYDANRWKNEAADARELLASSRSVVVNAVVETPTETTVSQNTVASTNPPATANTSTTPPATITTNTSTNPLSATTTINTSNNPPATTTTTTPTNNPTVAPITTPIMLPVSKQPKPTESAAKTDTPKEEIKKPENVETASNQNQTVAANPDAAKNTAPLAVGSLIEYATTKSNPVYPPTAKNLRMTGVVRVELVIDEQGQVTKVQNTSGPSLLQRAATDAIRKWKFKPFIRDGEPVKATGFVSFNFNL